MKSPQDYRDKAIEADAVVNDNRNHPIARAAHTSLARSWRHLADQMEWLDNRPTLRELREPGEAESG